MIQRVNYLFILVILFIGLSCSTEEPIIPSEIENVYLTESSEIQELSRTEFTSLLTNSLGSAAGQLSAFVQSGIKAVKLSYSTTTTDGKTITASGLMVIPTDIQSPMALGSIQHGTIFSDSLAPSYFQLQSEGLSGALLASTGVIVCMPDYVGYGASSSEPHPYEHNKGLAQANVDFLLAVKEYIRNEKLNWNNILMLAGYSEGGYATMATQKMLEEKYPMEFDIKASTLGAGAYNKTATMGAFLTDSRKGEINQNRSYIWVINTYNRIYGLNRPLSDFYVEPYLSQISQNGELAEIEVSFSEILNPQFTANILNGTDTGFISAVADNDIFDWKSNSRMFLIHGDADTYVPYINSETAVNAMKAKGSNISLNTVADGTHGSSIQTFFFETLNMFSEFKN